MRKAARACLCEYFLNLNCHDIHEICRDRWLRNLYPGVVFFSKNNANIYVLPEKFMHFLRNFIHYW